MSSKISRRDFLKLAGAGAAATTVLTGCGPLARHVVRRPYTDMPEFAQIGVSTYYATTCRECPAGCGLILRTYEGRAIKAEGNPAHPVNRGKICPRGVTAVQGLYNPDRFTGPRQHARTSEEYREIDWDTGIQAVTDALRAGGSTAFLLGGAPDHLFDLAGEIAAAAGAQAPIRYSTLGMFEGRATLIQAAQRIYGQARVPYFDVANSDIVFSFGANMLEEWLSPLTFARHFRQMRTNPQGRGRLVVFEPRQSVTAGAADEWVPIVPGSEGIVALALGRLIAEAQGAEVPAMYAGFDLDSVADQSGVPLERLEALANTFAGARQAVALPGGNALGHGQGLGIAQAVLALNTLSNGRPVAFTPTAEDGGEEETPEEPAPGSFEQISNLIERMNGGEVQALLIHGVNPVFELPPSLGFVEALANVPLVVSFASFPDETALLSDYVLPDHTGLESFGYQRDLPGADRPTLSASQPVVVPLYNTRAAADVLIAAAQAAGLGLDYTDEVAFIQSRIRPLVDANDPAGIFRADSVPAFWASFLQSGGWWTQGEQLEVPEEVTTDPIEMSPPEPLGEGSQLHFVAFPTRFGDGSAANRPWIQELPDPMTTVTWNSWVLIHPSTAQSLGIRDNDVVQISSDAGSLETVVYLYPAIRPDTIAMPFGQGHTALGRWAAGRGANPAQILTGAGNGAGDLAFADTRVTVAPTGRRRPLAVLESKLGVYGEGQEAQE
ncbi:MAG TPA: molybdopterin dinucleotide binding domain-containing protein [Anaerolineaceae bacterium]|nr:molybdopterin dinucleotide binding domain-containing protein [Anaerolineaceae bacterium]